MREEIGGNPRKLIRIKSPLGLKTVDSINLFCYNLILTFESFVLSILKIPFGSSNRTYHS